MGFPPCAFPFIGLCGGWGAQSVNSAKISMDTKQNQNPSEKTPKLKHPYAESDSDNDSDQTLFPKFIVLESMEDTPITKLSPFIIEKTHNSFIKAISVKNTNQPYPADRSGKKNFLRPKTKILLQLENQSLPPQYPKFVKGCSEKPRPLPVHFR